MTNIDPDVFDDTAWFNNKPEGLVYAGKVAYKYKGIMPSGSHITIEEGTLGIANSAFGGCSGLTTITIPNSVTNIGGNAFNGTAWYNNQPDGLVYAGKVAYQYKGEMPAGTEITLKEGTLGITRDAFSNCTGLTSLTIPNSVTNISGNAFYGCTSLTSVTIPNSVTTIGYNVFMGCTGLTSVTIPNSVTSIGVNCFSGCSSLTSVKMFRSIPVNFIGSGCFSNRSNAILYVPYGSKSAYEAADYWSEFKEIREMQNPNAINVGSSGFATFVSPNALDFSGITDVEAYIASDFDSDTYTLTLTKVTEAPAEEGLYIVGETGTHVIPETSTDASYSNLLKGVTYPTIISPTDGDKTNFILANGSHGIGFYTISKTGELAAGKAYLQLPTASVSSVKAISIIFDDEDAIQSIKADTKAQSIYNLQGQRVSQAKSGLYIINGKKTLIK